MESKKERKKERTKERKYDNNIRIISNFFRKFAEIFASQGAPPVSTTPAANFPSVSQVKVSRANASRYFFKVQCFFHRAVILAFL